MSAVPKQKLTAEEYLARERRAEYKSELRDGEMILMPRVGLVHNGIKDSLIGLLGKCLKGTKYHTLSSTQRLAVKSLEFYTYPDIVILTETFLHDPDDMDTLLNPVALIEVLSPSTEKYDRGAKFRNYKQIPSLMEYVLVAQDEPLCDRYIRQTDGSWALVSFVGLDATLEFTTNPAKVPLAEIYAGVEFEEAPK